MLAGVYVWLTLPAPADSLVSKPLSGKLDAEVIAERRKEAESSGAETRLTGGSIASGNLFSDADSFLSVRDPLEGEDAKSSGGPKVPVIGLDEEIRRGIDERLADPSEALSGVKPPEIPQTADDDNSSISRS